MKTNTLYKITSGIALASTLVSGSAQAADYAGSGDIQWSAVLSSLGLQSGDNLNVLNNSSTASLKFLNITNFTLGDFTINSSDLTTNVPHTFFSINNGNTLKTANLTISNRTTIYNGSLNVSGNLLINTTNANGKLVTSLGQNNSGNMEKLVVGGNFTSLYASVDYGRECVMIAAWSNARTTEAYNANYWNDADIDIGGKFEVAGVAKLYTSLQITGKYTSNVYMKVGALVSTSGSLSIMSNSETAKQKGVANIMITGKGSDYVNNTASFTSFATTSLGRNSPVYE